MPNLQLNAKPLHSVGPANRALDRARRNTLYKELKLPRGEAGVLINVGWVYGELGDTQQHLALYDRAEEIYRTIGDVDPVLISNFGSTYAQLGRNSRGVRRPGFLNR